MGSSRHSCSSEGTRVEREEVGKRVNDTDGDDTLPKMLDSVTQQQRYYVET